MPKPNPFAKKGEEEKSSSGGGYEYACCDPDSDSYDAEECKRKKAEGKTKDAISWVENVTFDKGNFRMTTDGYLVATARVARTGIQLYQGDEVGDTREFVRVYRPEKTVFDAKSMQTFAHRPVTLNHPPEMVNAHNWRDYAVGHVDGEIVRDGEMVKVPMLIMDAAAVQAVREGTSQLSVGYDARLEMTDGTTPQGEPYDAIQHDIRVNHIALTPSARGGPQLRLGDNQGDQKMEREVLLRKVTLDGMVVTLPEATADTVERLIDRLKTENETKDGKIAALTQQVKDATISDADLDARVTARQQLVAQAQKVLGEKWTPDGKSSADIRREAVTARLGDGVAKSLTDAAIEGAFTAVTAVELKDGSGTRELAQALARPGWGSNTKPNSEEAWEERGKLMREAWKGNNGSMVPRQ